VTAEHGEFSDSDGVTTPPASRKTMTATMTSPQFGGPNRDNRKREHHRP